MRVISYSDRVYYDDLGKDAQYIKNDLELYNQMKHRAYTLTYAMYCGRIPKLNRNKLEQVLKSEFNTSDYFSQSAISEAQGIFASNLETHKLHIKAIKNKIARMEKKRKENQKELTKLERVKKAYIDKTKKNGSLTKEEYLNEMKITSAIKDLKNKSGLIKGRLHNTKKKLEQLQKRMPSCCFGGRKLFKSQFTINQAHEDWYHSFHYARNKRMKITGRSQAKYSNNLFLYDSEPQTMTYRVSSEGVKHSIKVVFPLQFHYHKEELAYAIQLRPETKMKSICYELEDYGEYFIIKAIIQVDENVAKLSDTRSGVIGIDVNVDHLALCETDDRGNVVGFKTIPYDLRKKTSNQRLHLLRECFAQTFKYANDKGKPIVMEDLDFTIKKNKMLYGKKQYNGMLSSFAYSKIKEIAESRSYKDRMAIIQVNPAYTSYIGKEKYSRIKGANVHLCASYVIGRRGMGYEEKFLEDRRLYTLEDWKNRKAELCSN